MIDLCETCGEPAATGMRLCLGCIDAHDRAIGAGAYQAVGGTDHEPRICITEIYGLYDYDAIACCVGCGAGTDCGGYLCAVCDYHANATANPIAWDVVNARREAEFVAAMRSLGPDQLGLYVHFGQER